MRFTHIKDGRQEYWRSTVKGGSFWKLYRPLHTKRWFLTLYTQLEPGKLRAQHEHYSPVPFYFTRRNGEVIDKSHLEDSKQWNPERAMKWAREYIKGVKC